ncbi:MAG: hypothetical protein LBM12_00210 [Candidatus Nomurabacteria bacterium]|jgi:predicted RNase H-like HicB family nuclease|nr:hypothetical protein [Candidatus Nomurabacteria bacterium]
MEALIDLCQNFYYGILGRAPKIDFSTIPRSFTLNLHQDKKNGIYWVDSPDLPDFEATGKTLGELAKHIDDTFYVYFDIPRYFARRSGAPATVNLTDPRTGEAKSFTVRRQQLERAFAGA